MGQPLPILNGIYADSDFEFRTSYPRNLVPVPKDTSISKGYLRPADGIVQFSTDDGPGVDRAGINWNGVLYRVQGTKLVSVDAAGVITEIGDVGPGGQCSLDYSFDKLAVASGGRLYYWDGVTLVQVTDPDLGLVVDVQYIDGYFMTTDGENLVVTELLDPTQVDPLKYGSSELDPDPVLGVKKLRDEALAVNRYTVETFTNVGASQGVESFPFARNSGAQLHRGAIGTHAACIYSISDGIDGLAFLGSGRKESPAVWFGAGGATTKLSTREIDTILQTYTEAQLSRAVLETRVDKHQRELILHLPDRALVYDGAASQVVGEAVWSTRDSGLATPATYRARNLVWCYDAWLCGDPTSGKVGVLSATTGEHYGVKTGWDFGTAIIYGEGRGAIFHELELVGLPGASRLGDDPVIWTSYSLDGQRFSTEKPARAGRQGETRHRIIWRQQGSLRNWRIQRFRGTSDVHMPFARLDATIEQLGA